VWQNFLNTITAVTVCTSMGTLLLFLSPKNSMLCLLFLSQTCSCQEQCVRTKNSEGMMQLHNTKNQATHVIIHCSYEWCTGTKKHEWYLYMRTVYREKTDSNFNIFIANGLQTLLWICYNTATAYFLSFSWPLQVIQHNNFATQNHYQSFQNQMYKYTNYDCVLFTCF